MQTNSEVIKVSYSESIVASNTAVNYERVVDKYWDCPNLSCTGFLDIFQCIDSKLMSHVVCSMKRSKVSPCLQRTMFAKYQGICGSCKKPFKIQVLNFVSKMVFYKLNIKSYLVSQTTLITQGKDGKWVHAGCIGEKVKTICPRCSGEIEEWELADSSMSVMEDAHGRMQPFHVQCSSKRRRTNGEVSEYV